MTKYCIIEIRYKIMFVCLFCFVLFLFHQNLHACRVNLKNIFYPALNYWWTIYPRHSNDCLLISTRRLLQLHQKLNGLSCSLCQNAFCSFFAYLTTLLTVIIKQDCRGDTFPNAQLFSSLAVIDDWHIKVFMAY